MKALEIISQLQSMVDKRENLDVILSLLDADFEVLATTEIEVAMNAPRTAILITGKDNVHTNKERKIMRQFNIDEAKAGKPVCTRDGRDVRIICYDGKTTDLLGKLMPIIALIKNIEDNGEKLAIFNVNGNTSKVSSVLDLFMKDEEPTLADYTTIRTYEDACKALGEEPIHYVEVGYDNIENDLAPRHILALMKLETISRALRNGWRPNFFAEVNFWAPGFELREDEIVYFGERFQGMEKGIVDVNPRLWQESEEKARYFGTQFIDLWLEYLRED